MPVKPDSRFANLPLFRVRASDGRDRQVVALRLTKPSALSDRQHQVMQGEAIDLLAHRFYGDARLWWRILDANPAVYPLDIKAGDRLNLPDTGTATRITRTRKF
ncbi:tail protein X [Phormidesmis sp. 146-35]